MPENNGDDYYPMDQMTENNGLQCIRCTILSCLAMQAMQLKECMGGGSRVSRNSSPAFNLINCTSLLPQCHDAMMKKFWT